MQSGVEGEHESPHPPQLFGSFETSTHESVQQANPGEQPVNEHPFGGGGCVLQSPSMHDPPPHSIPQAPQLFGSLETSRQPSAQQSSPKLQPVVAHELLGATQVPWMHESPDAQTMPQPPQLKGSETRFESHGPASVSPPSPAMHVSVVGSHVVPFGQLAFAHEPPWPGSPSSDSRVEREQPRRIPQRAAAAKRTAA
jgi:hypothetical protein